MTGLLLLSLLPALASARFGVPGGRVDVTPDFDYAPVAFAVQAINDKFLRDGDTAPRQLAEIVSAQSQVQYHLREQIWLPCSLLPFPTLTVSVGGHNED